MQDHFPSNADGLTAAIVDSLPCFAFRWLDDAAETITHMTDGVSQLLGYPPSHFVNNFDKAFEKLVHPEEAEHLRAVTAAAFSARTPWDVDYRMRRADGSWLWVREISRLVCGKSGVIEHVDSLVFDIDARKQRELATEKRLIEMAELAPAIASEAQGILKVLGSLHLLGLNARIEAARAGEHGAGFSVVAQEISKLSAVSSTKAESIIAVTAKLR
jgi:PAS domain S-box-containing protein